MTENKLSCWLIYISRKPFCVSAHGCKVHYNCCSNKYGWKLNLDYRFNKLKVFECVLFCFRDIAYLNRFHIQLVMRFGMINSLCILYWKLLFLTKIFGVNSVTFMILLISLSALYVIVVVLKNPTFHSTRLFYACCLKLCMHQVSVFRTP